MPLLGGACRFVKALRLRVLDAVFELVLVSGTVEVSKRLGDPATTPQARPETNSTKQTGGPLQPPFGRAFSSSAKTRSSQRRKGTESGAGDARYGVRRLGLWQGESSYESAGFLSDYVEP